MTVKHKLLEGGTGTVYFLVPGIKNPKKKPSELVEKIMQDQHKWQNKKNLILNEFCFYCKNSFFNTYLEIYWYYELKIQHWKSQVSQICLFSYLSYLSLKISKNKIKLNFSR